MKSIQISLTAKNYADALVKIGQDNVLSYSDILYNLESVKEICESSSELDNVLKNPAVSDDVKYSIVDFFSAKDDIARIKAVVNAYESEKSTPFRKEVINGSSFFIPYDIVSADLMNKLELCSRNCPEDSYTVANDDGKLVIY